MAKRKTKEQREAEQWQALYVRVCDIMAQCGCGIDPDDDDFSVFVEDLCSVIKAVELRLLPEHYKEDQAFLTATFNLNHYRDSNVLTDFLFQSGIRA